MGKVDAYREACSATSRPFAKTNWCHGIVCSEFCGSVWVVKDYSEIPVHGLQLALQSICNIC